MLHSDGPLTAVRRRVRSALLALVACWLVVFAAPAAAHPSAASVTDTPAEVAAAAGSDTLELAGTDPAGDDDGEGADRELVLSLVAIVLLAVAIGLHALYRDQG